MNFNFHSGVERAVVRLAAFRRRGWDFYAIHSGSQRLFSNLLDNFSKSLWYQHIVSTNKQTWSNGKLQAHL
ncbi:hypothetical protein DVU_2457 [Nitratidesulfovibrio vulgaris str. Hildenborough]|uniref:Uncharacterized protein n=1 Tax=Nitratidesulfovibrio vulgaris (strain ATCC 29579 / DSM 644 / CCUG 34227 / NCIMB 8303 / VKM B-1760 / Hildenborough) TaxID=882 RepID=Q728Z5_NITV2|nr:hypothetical protein DVU_2457 [Nitratidesulfovibrio vulgaris str. Hildenborough]